MSERPADGGRELSRRTLMGLLAAAGIGTAAACTDTSGPTDSGNKGGKGGKGTTANSTPGATSKGFKIGDTGAKLPTGNVKVNWMDSGDTKAYLFKAFVAAYHKKHANITIDYNGSNWNNITQVLTTGLRNGSAPDVFQLPSQIPAHVAITNGWIGAFDDIVPNFAELKKAYPPGVFGNGVTDFNGKTYLIPLTGSQRIGNLLLYNADYAKQAGLDLGSKPMNWDELRANAKKLTKQGSGQYYGLIMGLGQPGGFAGPASDMATMSGLHGGIDGVNWKTGEYNHTDPLAQEIIELFLAMRDDGSIHPDSTNLDQPGARGRMPQGQAAMIFQGPWNIPIWRQDNPDFNLGLQLPAQKNPNDIWPLNYGPGGSNTWTYFGKTKYPTVVGDAFAYLMSLDGQQQWAAYDPVADPPALPEALVNVKLDPLNAKASKFGRQYTVLGPQPAARNLDVQQVYLAQVPPTPTFNDRLVGLYTKQIDKPVKQVLQDAKDAAERSLDKAIADAKKKGAKVSREDWVFKDWDPRKPYTSIYEK